MGSFPDTDIDPQFTSSTQMMKLIFIRNTECAVKTEESPKGGQFRIKLIKPKWQVTEVVKPKPKPKLSDVGENAIVEVIESFTLPRGLTPATSA